MLVKAFEALNSEPDSEKSHSLIELKNKMSSLYESSDIEKLSPFIKKVNLIAVLKFEILSISLTILGVKIGNQKGKNRRVHFGWTEEVCSCIRLRNKDKNKLIRHVLFSVLIIFRISASSFAGTNENSGNIKNRSKSLALGINIELIASFPIKSSMIFPLKCSPPTLSKFDHFLTVILKV